MDENFEKDPKENIEEKANSGNSEPEDREDRLVSEPDEDGVRYYDASKLKKRSGRGNGAGSAQGQASGHSHSLRNALIILGIILAVVIFLGVSCSQLGGSVTKSLVISDSQEETVAPDSPYIAVLNVEGTIQEGNGSGEYQHSWTLDKIDELMNDSNNRGIIFFVNSPGGGVYESDELYFKIKEYQEETGCPVYSAMGEMAASGGYYISAPCDKIFANRNCWTGSIGVTIGTIYDISGLLEKYGIKTQTITSGKNKAMGSSVEPLTEEQQAIYQSLVDEAYEQFVGIVAEGRDMSTAEVKEIADGRVYSANQALELGLVDEVGTLSDAENDMMEEYDLWDCDVVTLEPGYTSTIFDTLFSELDALSESKNSDVAALLNAIEESSDCPLSYLCELTR